MIQRLCIFKGMSAGRAVITWRAFTCSHANKISLITMKVISQRPADIKNEKNTSELHFNDAACVSYAALSICTHGTDPLDHEDPGITLVVETAKKRNSMGPFALAPEEAKPTAHQRRHCFRLRSATHPAVLLGG